MELFPAGDDDAWTLIRQIIDESDYYLLVVGGRYGTVEDATQLSYTEKEFDYAVSRKKPVMAFLHGDPGSIPFDKSEPTEEARAKLEAFREKVGRGKHVNYWTGAENLAGKVALSFPKLQRAHPAVGWVRGDVQTSTESLEELNRLRKRLEEAESRLEAVRRGPPPGTDNLAQGIETISIPVSVSAEFGANMYPHTRYERAIIQVTATWDEVFAAVGPALFDESSQGTMHEKLNAFFGVEAYDEAAEQFDAILNRNSVLQNVRITGGTIWEDDFDTLLVQLRALGLITKSERKRSVKDTGTYWTLTPYGDERLTALRAIHRAAPEPNPDGVERANGADT
jgi:hypothetical protein